MKKLLRTFILRCSHKWEPDCIESIITTTGATYWNHYTSPNNIAYKINLSTGQWFCFLKDSENRSISGYGIWKMFSDDRDNHTLSMNHVF